MSILFQPMFFIIRFHGLILSHQENLLLGQRISPRIVRISEKKKPPKTCANKIGIEIVSLQRSKLTNSMKRNQSVTSYRLTGISLKYSGISFHPRNSYLLNAISAKIFNVVFNPTQGWRVTQ